MEKTLNSLLAVDEELSELRQLSWQLYTNKSKEIRGDVDDIFTENCTSKLDYAYQSISEFINMTANLIDSIRNQIGVSLSLGGGENTQVFYLIRLNDDINRFRANKLLIPSVKKALLSGKFFRFGQIDVDVDLCIMQMEDVITKLTNLRPVQVKSELPEGETLKEEHSPTKKRRFSPDLESVLMDVTELEGDILDPEGLEREFGLGTSITENQELQSLSAKIDDLSKLYLETTTVLERDIAQILAELAKDRPQRELDLSELTNAIEQFEAKIGTMNTINSKVSSSIDNLRMSFEEGSSLYQSFSGDLARTFTTQQQSLKQLTQEAADILNRIISRDEPSGDIDALANRVDVLNKKLERISHYTRIADDVYKKAQFALGCSDEDLGLILVTVSEWRNKMIDEPHDTLYPSQELEKYIITRVPGILEKMESKNRK